MKKGEEVTVKIEYDLFGLQLKGLVGVYVSTSKSTKKILLYFSQNGEWAELHKQQIKRINPGHVSVKNKNFIDNTTKLKYSG